MGVLKQMASLPVHCVLCLNLGHQVTATTMLQAYVVCDEHALIDAWVLYGDGTLNLPATLNKLRRKAPERGSPT